MVKLPTTSNSRLHQSDWPSQLSHSMPGKNQRDEASQGLWALEIWKNLGGKTCANTNKKGGMQGEEQKTVGIIKFRSHVPTWLFFGEARVVRNFKQEKTVKSQNTQLAGWTFPLRLLDTIHNVSVIKPRHIPQINFPGSAQLGLPDIHVLPSACCSDLWLIPSIHGNCGIAIGEIALIQPLQGLIGIGRIHP